MKTIEIEIPEGYESRHLITKHKDGKLTHVIIEIYEVDQIKHE